MKKSFLLIALLVIGYLINAQGTLQFNQVIRVKNTSVSSGNVTTITVPAGKVWKIESGTGPDGYELSIDGQLVYASTAENFAVNQYFYIKTIPLPIWLPAGSYAVTVSNSLNGNYTTVLSGIEFNVLQ